MKTLDELWSRGRAFLNVQYPVLCGAMTWISDSGLVSAVSNSGGLGSLAAGNMEPELLEQEIIGTRQLTDKPFAVNLITIAPRYHEHLEVAASHNVPFIVFAGGIPSKHDIAQAKQSGAKVICFAAAESLAKRLLRNGADALMLEGSEAGGHIGHVSLSILIQQVLFAIDEVPIFVAGGIGTGRIIPHLLLMGASGVQMGTRFVMTEECSVHPAFQKAFIRAHAKDAIATPYVLSELKVVPVRALKNKGMEAFLQLQMELVHEVKNRNLTMDEAQIKVEEFWAGALRKAAKDGDVANGSLMAGQSVGLVKKVQPLDSMMKELVTEAESELKCIQNILV